MVPLSNYINYRSPPEGSMSDHADHETNGVSHANHDMHDMQMHPMYFHFGSQVKVLFQFWDVTSPIGIILTCIVIIIGCFCMEFVRYFRLYRKKQRLSQQNQEPQNARRIDSSVIGDGLLHAVQLTLSYMLMLIFMTFNVWLCGAVIVGEVLSRIVLSVFFPQLEKINEALASTETCCG
ncbi:ctr copper transporter family domain-containing protein [Ditylenchus destructor]|nr:ctr copper transporter family domain-containing protein [Ditylenchus destructor]